MKRGNARVCALIFVNAVPNPCLPCSRLAVQRKTRPFFNEEWKKAFARNLAWVLQRLHAWSLTRPRVLSGLPFAL